MSRLRIALPVVAVLPLLIAGADTPAPDTPAKVPAALDFTMKNIDGADVKLADYRGQVLLVVNVASQCGYTPQYKDLEALYRKYKDRGLRILAFPANEFGGQEPGSNAEIKKFCQSRFEVSFDLFEKVVVKGEGQCPLYAYLTDAERNTPHGGDIRWNFEKFLIDRDGEVAARYKSADKPLGDDMVNMIEKLLGKP